METGDENSGSPNRIALLVEISLGQSTLRYPNVHLQSVYGMSGPEKHSDYTTLSDGKLGAETATFDDILSVLFTNILVIELFRPTFTICSLRA